MTEDLRPGAEQLTYHLDLLSRWSRGTPLEHADWTYTAATRIDSLHVVYGYVTVDERGTHAAHVHEDYDEIALTIFDPLPFATV